MNRVQKVVKAFVQAEKAKKRVKRLMRYTEGNDEAQQELDRLYQDIRSSCRNLEEAIRDAEALR